MSPSYLDRIIITRFLDTLVEKIQLITGYYELGYGIKSQICSEFITEYDSLLRLIESNEVSAEVAEIKSLKEPVLDFAQGKIEGKTLARTTRDLASRLSLKLTEIYHF